MNIKRNSLAVRLDDYDYEQFMENTGRTYSLTLRALIELYNKYYQTSDENLSPKDRVKAVMGRI